MSLPRYIIISGAIAVAVLARYLIASTNFHHPFPELMSYILILAGAFWHGAGFTQRPTLGQLRAQIHRKFGFTCVFCLGCAVLLSTIGAAWPPPDIKSLPVPSLEEGQNGYREPPVVRAGDTVRVHFFPQRQLVQMAISGLWKANVIKATLVTDKPRRLIPLPDVVSLPAAETWEDVNPRDGKLYFRPTQQQDVIPRFKNEPLTPWIEFSVPYDESLTGKEATVHVEMTGVYPHLIRKGEYQTEEFRLIEDVPFYVATEAEFAAFQDYRARWESWTAFQRFRFYAAMTFLWCGVVFWLLVVRRPRPSGIPVRLMSRRIGQ